MDTADNSHPPVRELYPVHEALELLFMSKSHFYEEVRAGRLRTVKRGRHRLVPAGAITAYVQQLISETEVQHGETA